MRDPEPRGYMGSELDPYDRYSAPSPETGRNPEAVTDDLLSGALLIPGLIVAFLTVFLATGVLRYSTLPPPKVSLNEALTSLIAIEDDYYGQSGSSQGLRQRITSWYQWAQLDRRLEYELRDVPAGAARTRAEEKGKKAVESISTIVEYSGYASNGIADPRESGRFADEFVARATAAGQGEALNRQAADGLRAGREALAESVRLIDEALED